MTDTSVTKRLDGGLVIMFDGPDGVGKTAQVGLAAEALRQEGYDVYTTRINGGTPIGEALRGVMLADIPRTAKTDLFIIKAAHAELSNDLRQRRRQGIICLVDRSPLSVIAYQVYGDGLNKAYAFQAVDKSIDDFKPELMLVYRADQSVFMARMAARDSTHKRDHFEAQPPAYFKRVAEGYREAAAHYHATTINASASIAAVHATTMQHIRSVLQSRSALLK